MGVFGQAAFRYLAFQEALHVFFARQGKLRVGSVELVELISSIIKIIQIRPQYSDIKFIIDSNQSNVTIEADPDQLKQVILQNSPGMQKPLCKIF